MNEREKVWYFIRHLNRLTVSGWLSIVQGFAVNAADADLTMQERDAAFLKVAEIIGAHELIVTEANRP